MWGSRLSLRISVLLFLSVAITSCNTKKDDPLPVAEPLTETSTTTASTTATDTTAPAPLSRPAYDVCGSGNTSKGRPVICVDDLGKPDPPMKYAWDVKKKNNVETPVVLTWLSKYEDADMSVVFDDLKCATKQPVCKKNQGECSVTLKKLEWATIQPGTPEDKKQFPCGRYKVSITIDGKTTDPYGELIVNPCCW